MCPYRFLPLVLKYCNCKNIRSVLATLLFLFITYSKKSRTYSTSSVSCNTERLNASVFLVIKINTEIKTKHDAKNSQKC